MSDFTFSSSDIEHVFSSGIEVSCLSGDIDCLSGDANDKNNEEEHHCHCHLGHIHTTVFPKKLEVEKCPSYFAGQVYYDLISNYYYNYLAEIIKPPIA